MATITLGTLRDYWKAVYDAIVTGGSAAKSTGLQVAGTDGTNGRVLKTKDDGTLITEVTGRNAVVKSSAINFSTTITKGSNNSEEIVVPAGKIWTVQDVTVSIIPPTGATNGTHKEIIYLGSGNVIIAFVETAYNKRIGYSSGDWVDYANGQKADTYIPNDASAVAVIFKNLVLTAGESLVFRYFNNTDADQTNARNIWINVIEEASA